MRTEDKNTDVTPLVNTSNKDSEAIELPIRENPKWKFDADLAKNAFVITFVGGVALLSMGFGAYAIFANPLADKAEELGCEWQEWGDPEWDPGPSCNGPEMDHGYCCPIGSGPAMDAAANFVHNIAGAVFNYGSVAVFGTSLFAAGAATYADRKEQKNKIKNQTNNDEQLDDDNNDEHELECVASLPK